MKLRNTWLKKQCNFLLFSNLKNQVLQVYSDLNSDFLGFGVFRNLPVMVHPIPTPISMPDNK